MKSIKQWLYFTVAVAIFSAGCSKTFLDVNEDPNRVTDTNITPELILSQAENSIGAWIASPNNAHGYGLFADWMGYTSSAGDFALPQDEVSYNIDFSFSNTFWFTHYHNLFDLSQVKTKSLAKGDSVMTGAAMILSVKLWQELVDIYGNIPYSKAFQNGLTRTPGYDRAQDVYADLSKVLDTAVLYMQKTRTSSFASADVALHGNQARWIKFANTLRLRLAIRQSEIAGYNPASEMAKILANGGLLHAGESVSVNPGYSDQTGKQSPYYGTFAFTPTGSDANAAVRANAYIVNILSSTNDPRLFRFFRTPSAGGNITGTVFGSTVNPDGAHSSKVGLGLAASAAQDQWLFPSFESMFLEAEAITRGWLPGDAQTAYENAVRESFVWLNVPNAVNAANAYLANVSIAKWSNSGATVLSKAKFIAYQKYIALTGIDPVESWCDLRRLNFLPDPSYISQNPSRISNTLPVRLLYPQTEYTTNGDNVNAQGTINLFTSKIFWQP
jgi:hypothetical protein